MNKPNEREARIIGYIIAISVLVIIGIVFYGLVIAPELQRMAAGGR